MNWILNRFKEPSSWRGLIGLASIFGLALSPELKEQIITIAVAAVGLVEIIRKEKDHAGDKAKGEQGTVAVDPTEPETTGNVR